MSGFITKGAPAKGNTSSVYLMPILNTPCSLAMNLLVLRLIRTLTMNIFIFI